MLARYRFLPLLLMLLAAASCSKKTTQEQATETAPTDGDEIDPYSNLVFTFDEKVVDEGKINQWDTTHFVTFSPNIRGKFKWTGDRELAFSPLEPFRPSTVFSASLRPETLPRDKQKAFYYLCRAVSKGTFKLGPVNADAMYNADYHSYNGAGTVRVK